MRNILILLFISISFSVFCQDIAQGDIYASSGWQSTGVTVNAGTKLIVKADGSWSTSSWAGKFGPDGGGLTASSNYYKVYSDAALGSLIMRIGLTKYEIGSYAEVTVEEYGEIEFRMNDTKIEDNSGSVKVRVSKKPTFSSSSSSLVKVKANKGWQNSEFYVKKGDVISLNATGTWTTSPLTGRLSPNGGGMSEQTGEGPKYRILQTQNDGRTPALVGALIGVITEDGDTGTMFYIGDGLKYTAPQSGYLYMSCNDNLPTDNSGTLTVKITPQ